VPALAEDRAFVETEELRIVYYDPGESYLVPHVTQSFLSGLADNERLFDWAPSGGVNVWLRDFGDVADASTYPAPRNRITVDVAPAYAPYETFSSAVRFELYATHGRILPRWIARAPGCAFPTLLHGKVITSLPILRRSSTTT
jgi:hypothetical protein